MQQSRVWKESYSRTAEAMTTRQNLSEFVVKQEAVADSNVHITQSCLIYHQTQ